MDSYIQDQSEKETNNLSHHLHLRTASKKNGTMPRSPTLSVKVETNVWLCMNCQVFHFICLLIDFPWTTKVLLYSFVIKCEMYGIELAIGCDFKVHLPSVHSRLVHHSVLDWTWWMCSQRDDDVCVSICIYAGQCQGRGFPVC